DHADARTRQPGPRGLRGGPRLHGDVGVLRDGRRAGGDRDHPPRARARRHLPGLGRHVRPVHQREARRTRGRAVVGGAPGRRDEVRQRARRERRVPRHPRRRGLRPRVLRRLPGATRSRHDRPLLPAPRRPGDADRGDGRRDGRARAGGQGPLPRALGGGRRHDPPRARRAPDLRGAERVLAVGARPGGARAPRAARARDRLRRLLAARSRLPDGCDPARRGPRRVRRPPPALPPLRAREPRAQPRAGRACRGAGGRPRRHPGPARPRLGPRPGGRRRPDPGDQAREVPRGERRGGGDLAVGGRAGHARRHVQRRGRRRRALRARADALDRRV
ncbi:MAG: Oxidoreductase, aldo/keto reductase family, partial [uncultured Solirubrobacteraceae bacterium]